MTSLRAAFPAWTGAAYLDSACTTLRPAAVIDAVADAQRTGVACHGRSNHAWGRATGERFDAARRAVGAFVGARSPQEVVFVRSTTEAINLVASCLPLRRGDVVLTTDIEHNSNWLPWMRAARARGIEHRVLRVDPVRGVELAAFEQAVRGVRLVAVPHVSNLLGITLPAAELTRAARRAGALVLLDGAQAVATHPVDVAGWDVDFYAWSFHKMFGPTGIGALVGRRALLETMPPLLVGGGAVSDVTAQGPAWEVVPDRFEAGVPHYDGVVGAHAAVDWLSGVGVERVGAHVAALNERATAALGTLPRVRILGPRSGRGAILNFVVDGLAAEGVARVLDQRHGVLVRHGRHCVHTWYAATGTPESVRASFSIYNDDQDVDRLVAGVRACVGLVA